MLQGLQYFRGLPYDTVDIGFNPEPWHREAFSCSSSTSSSSASSSPGRICVDIYRWAAAISSKRRPPICYMCFLSSRPIGDRHFKQKAGAVHVLWRAVRRALVAHTPSLDWIYGRTTAPRGGEGRRRRSAASRHPILPRFPLDTPECCSLERMSGGNP